MQPAASLQVRAKTLLSVVLWRRPPHIEATDALPPLAVSEATVKIYISCRRRKCINVLIYYAQNISYIEYNKKNHSNN